MTAWKLFEEAELLSRSLESWRMTMERGRIRGSMRRVLEQVASAGAITVPAIARARGVSRQSVQAHVDALQSLGMLRRTPNPAHRRSSLVVLTDAGRAWLEDTRAREEHTLARMQVGVSDTAIVDATRVLAAWRDALADVHSEE